MRPRLCLAGILFGFRLFPIDLSAGEIALPLNQTLTPEGDQTMLPGVRPKVLALSPDRRLLLTSGATDKLLVLDPANGALRQTLDFPKRTVPEEIPGPAAELKLLRDPGQEASFAGLEFSPDGARVYLSDLHGTIKVFGVEKSGRVSALDSLELPPANAPARNREIPAGLAVSPDGLRLYVAANLSNGLLELDSRTGSVAAALRGRSRALRSRPLRRQGLRQQLGRAPSRRQGDDRAGGLGHFRPGRSGSFHRQRRLGDDC